MALSGTAGVNSSLEDVMVLQKALAETGNDLGKALERYEKDRKDDIYGLAHIQPIGFPYQYNKSFSLGKVCGFTC